MNTTLCIFCFMKESVQDRPAAVCGADRPTARESAFPTITLKIFGKRERKNHMNWNIITDSSCDLLPSTSPDGRIRLASVPFTIASGSGILLMTSIWIRWKCSTPWSRNTRPATPPAPRRTHGWHSLNRRTARSRSPFLAAVRQYEQRSCGKRYGAGEKSG